MATYVPAKKNTAFILYVNLVDAADTTLFKANPTIATGDFKVSIDGGAFADLATDPTVTPAGGRAVKISLSAGEMNGDNIEIVAHDASGAEWCDKGWNIQTTARQIDDLAFPTVSGRSLDVTATGAAGIDFGNVENPTTTINFSGTTIKTATDIATQITALLTTAVADSVAADGSRPSVAQALLMLTRFLNERAVVGTTMTVFKEDGTTPSMTFTLDDGTDPTAITRAT